MITTNFDNPCWSDLQITYESYQEQDDLLRFYKKYVCSQCRYEIPCMSCSLEVRERCKEFHNKDKKFDTQYWLINEFLQDVANYESGRRN